MDEESKGSALEAESVYSSDDCGEQDEDWYNSLDTSDDIPDPNLIAELLYQDQDSLPKPLRKSHFWPYWRAQ